MRTRLISVLLSALAACTLSSCLDYEEQLTIHSDLSGEALVTLHLPDTLLEKYFAVSDLLSEESLRKRFDVLSGVKLISYQRTDDRKPVITLQVKFSSLEKLSEAIAANPPAGILAGQFTVTRQGSTTTLERKLGVGEPSTDLPDFNFANYTTHFDSTIVKTNSGFFNNHGSDVRYRYKLTEVVAGQPVMRNELASPTPWLWIGVGTIAALTAAWYGWKAMPKKTVRR